MAEFIVVALASRRSGDRTDEGARRPCVTASESLPTRRSRPNATGHAGQFGQPPVAQTGSQSSSRSTTCRQVLARAQSNRERGAAVVGAGVEDRADGGDERVGVGGDVEQVGVEPAFGQGGRDDRPAGPHVVHDLGRAAGQVERVVGPVGDQADVERAVVEVDRLLGPPAEGVDVGPGQAAPAVGVPGRRAAWAPAGRPGRSRPSGKRLAEPGQERPSRSGPPAYPT